MILLNTDVIFDAMKPELRFRVRHWLDGTARYALFLSIITFTDLMSFSLA